MPTSRGGSRGDSMVVNVHGVLALEDATLRKGAGVYRAVVSRTGLPPVTYEILGRRGDGPQADGTTAVVSGSARMDYKRRVIVIECTDLTFVRASMIRPFVWFTLSGRVLSSQTANFVLEARGFIHGQPFLDVVNCHSLCPCAGALEDGQEVQVLAAPSGWDNNAINFEVKDVEVL